MKKKFSSWINLPGGGRSYFYIVPSKYGWSAKYIKEVDEFEQTTRFYQEIYNDRGKLVEIHEKYPEDKGHIKITEGEK